MILLSIIVGLAAAFIVIIATITKQLKLKSSKLSEQIKQLEPYSRQPDNKQTEAKPPQINQNTFIDIPTYTTFLRIVSFAQDKNKTLSIISNHIIERLILF